MRYKLIFLALTCIFVTSILGEVIDSHCIITQLLGECDDSIRCWCSLKENFSNFTESMNPLGDPVDLVGLRGALRFCISKFPSHAAAVGLQTIH